MRVARSVVLEPDQQEALGTRARARSASARSVERRGLFCWRMLGCRTGRSQPINNHAGQGRPLAQPIPGRRIAGAGERCAASRKNAPNYAGQNPGRHPYDEAGEASQRDASTGNVYCNGEHKAIGWSLRSPHHKVNLTLAFCVGVK